MPEDAGVVNTGRADWSNVAIDDRARVIGKVAGCVADRVDILVSASRTPQRTADLETLSAELLPFAEACRYLAKHANRILSPRTCGWRGRPFWLWGVTSTVHRVPLGTVLILGAWNYPLMLAGIQAAQALVAGNRVLWKPAPGCEAITSEIIKCFHDAGIPADALECLPSSVEAACEAIDNGVDLVVLTGAASTGRAVLRRAAETLTPTIMELSGCDAMVIMPDADLQVAAKALAFGLTLNSGATCIAPRRIFVHDDIEKAFAQCVIEALEDAPQFHVHPAARATAARVISNARELGAIAVTRAAAEEVDLESGTMKPIILSNVHEKAELRQADVFAPIAGWYRWQDESHLVESLNDCRYGLGASLFGNVNRCVHLARKLHVGSVVVNDLIVPTADPRLPFGGRRESGFGVTRGVEGLLAMTTTRVISVQRSGLKPHLQPPDDSTEPILRGMLQFRFAPSFRKRVAGLQQLVRGVRLSKNKN